MNPPIVTDVDRAAGFRDLEVCFCDGRKKTMRIFKPEPLRLLEILRLPSMTARLIELNAYCLHVDIDFLLNVTGASGCKFFFVAMGLNSQATYDATLEVSREIGWKLICENKPGMAEQLGKQANN
jgi:hypothetical protein